MKKILIVFMLFAFCTADTIYYSNNMMLTNCKVTKKENIYTVQAFTKNGINEMNISRNEVKKIEYSPVDSSTFSQMITTIKGKRVNITEINEKRLKADTKKEIPPEEIKSGFEKNQSKYEIKPNIPFLATGTALSTMGIITLVNTIKTSELINFLDANEDRELIQQLRKNQTGSFLYGTLLTIAGGINIYYGFEKINIDINSNEIKLSYNF